MLRRISSIVFFVALSVSSAAFAAEDHVHLPQVKWSFDGITGTYDRAAMQRGYQVYKQVCAACHSMKYVAYRNLTDIGLTELQVKALAAEITVMDGPNDEGEMFERPGLPSDHFKSPYANEKAARASNNGAYPPDQSLLVKARHDGSNYVYGILTGYGEPPADIKLNPGMHYNKYFPGHQIGMAPPLVDGAVQYADGTEATVDQMAKDVTHFLTWAAEPKMEARKQTGIKVILFLIVFAGIMYAAKRKIWRKLKNKPQE